LNDCLVTAANCTLEVLEELVFLLHIIVVVTPSCLREIASYVPHRRSACFFTARHPTDTISDKEQLGIRSLKCLELFRMLQQPEAQEDGDDDWGRSLRRWAEHSMMMGGERLLDEALARFERIMIESALDHCQGRRQDAARVLGWGRNTLTRKIKEHDIQG